MHFLVWKLFPHPVGIFCTLLEPPNCHIVQQTIFQCLFIFLISPIHPFKGPCWPRRSGRSPLGYPYLFSPSSADVPLRGMDCSFRSPQSKEHPTSWHSLLAPPNHRVHGKHHLQNFARGPKHPRALWSCEN